MAKRKRPEIAGVGEQIFGSAQSAAVSDLLPQVSSVYLEEIPLDSIEPNPYQPRDAIEHDDALDELAASIRERGILQPIRLRPHGERYQLIAGERRWRAARLAGLEAVPAVVVDADDDSMRVEAIIENLQREDLNEIERANALRTLKESLNLTWDEVAAKVGLTRRSVMRIVGLTTLPEPVQELIADGRLSEKHGRALRGLKETPEKQLELAQMAVSDGLSGEQTQTLVKRVRKGDAATGDDTGKLVGEAAGIIEHSAANLNKVFTRLVEVSLKKRDQQSLLAALSTLEDAVQSLRHLWAER